VASARAPEPLYCDEQGTIPVAHYGEERLALEREHLFRALPIPIGHVSEKPDARGMRTEERHGLVWGTHAPAIDVRAHLGEIDDEIAALGLDRCVVGERNVAEHPGNWKLPMEGFLESYHIRSLHRASVYPFFLDARAAVERAGQHVRAATARRIAREQDVESGAPLRELATPSWTIFPCTTLIAHPDWTSLVVVEPRGADRFAWTHLQLLPEAPRTDAARAHFARSFALIQGGVFEAEDLRMAALIQAGLASGANESLLFGRLESPALWFHESIARALQS
ncbi:MAG TPA: SRPBCC family protein, partial [Labilithrix sp.]